MPSRQCFGVSWWHSNFHSICWQSDLLFSLPSSNTEDAQRMLSTIARGTGSWQWLGRWYFLTILCRTA